LLPRTRPPAATAELLPGFRSPSRHPPRESTYRQASQFLPTFRPQCFAHSRRLTPPCTLRACFIPQPRPRFTLQGFSPVPSQPDSSPACALLTFLLAPLQPSYPACAGSRTLASRTLIQAPIRWLPTELLRLPTPRSPLELSVPSGFPPNTVATPSRPFRSWTCLPIPRVTPAGDLQRIASARLFSLSPDLLPVRTLRASFHAAEATLPTSPD